IHSICRTHRVAWWCLPAHPAFVPSRRPKLRGRQDLLMTLISPAASNPGKPRGCLWRLEPLSLQLATHTHKPRSQTALGADAEFMQFSITVPGNQQEEHSMRRAALIALLLIAAAAFAPRPASAAYNLPWCAQYADDSNILNCAFTSMEQCQETVRGIG